MTAKPKAAQKPRRKRCSHCGELIDPAELTEIGHDRLCESCLDSEAAQVPDGEPTAPSDPGLADAIGDAAETVGVRIDTPEQAGVWLDSYGDSLREGGDEGRAAPELPAPSIQVDAPMPDLRDEDEKVEKPRRSWNLPNWEVPGWPLRYGRISPSALGCFARCPEQFRRKYILGEAERFGAPGITGTGIHKALARHFEYVMAQGEPLPRPLAYEAFDESLAYAFRRQLERFGDIDWGHDGSRAKAPMTEEAWRERGRTVIDTYLESVAPGVAQPIGVEQVFTISLPTVPVPVVGFIDLVTMREMADYKFGQRRSFQVSSEWRIQGLTYLLARDLPMTWHSMNWSGEFSIPMTDPGLILPNTFANYSIGSDLVASMVRGILSYATTFGRDAPWPGNIAHTWACQTCHYREAGRPPCAWWHRDAEEAVL